MDNFILGTIELIGAPSSSPDYIYVHAYLHVNKFLTTRYIYIIYPTASNMTTISI